MKRATRQSLLNQDSYVQLTFTRNDNIVYFTLKQNYHDRHSSVMKAQSINININATVVILM